MKYRLSVVVTVKADRYVLRLYNSSVQNMFVDIELNIFENNLEMQMNVYVKSWNCMLPNSLVLSKNKRYISNTFRLSYLKVL